MVEENYLANTNKLYLTPWSGQSPFGELQNGAEGRKILKNKD